MMQPLLSKVTNFHKYKIPIYALVQKLNLKHTGQCHGDNSILCVVGFITGQEYHHHAQRDNFNFDNAMCQLPDPHFLSGSST
jgi:hypothetical protein